MMNACVQMKLSKQSSPYYGHTFKSRGYTRMPLSVWLFLLNSYTPMHAP